MIKILKYNQIMQNEIEEFIIKNMNKELTIDKGNFIEITRDLKDIENNYLKSGGEVLFAYDMENKKIVGTIAIKIENDITLLKRFYVDEKYRKRKIGYLLYSKLEKYMKEKRINEIYLTTGNELIYAHKFYERNGWKIENKNPGIYIRTGAKLYKKNLKGEIKMNKEEQADILIEAIPYIKEYSGKIIVIKYGGNAMTDKKLKENIIKQISLLKMLGIKIVLVHGGGPDIEEELKCKKIDSKFENGLRVTDEKTIEVVKMVLIGKTNLELVNLLNLNKCKAIGLSGLDNSFLKCKKYDNKIGYVGEIKQVDTKLLLKLLEEDYVPVISPIGVDEFGNTYNVNADTVASEIAIALKSKKIIFLTNTNGILDKENNLISLIEKDKIDSLIKDKIIYGGMIPKIKACKKCLENGVEKAHILNGLVKNTIIHELLSDNGIGTMIDNTRS